MILKGAEMTPYLKLRLANKGARAEVKAEAGTVWLYDFIAADDEEAMWLGGISPKQFMAALSETQGPVTLRVNSPGGSVFGAQAMVTAMRAHGSPITVQVDSIAASAASVIAMAGEKLVMAPGAMLMIHKAWSITVGNSDDHMQTAELLDKIDGQIAGAYAEKAGGDAAKFLDLMAAETWFTAQEAMDAGLADALVEENTQRPKAAWDLSVYTNAPKAGVAEQVLNTDEVVVPEGPTKQEQSARRQRQLAARLLDTAI
ncbi:MAG: Clp protease ClpP [Rhodobacteraceae bacterium]|nr:Clp protease ClpP [Paracoccaceae bacterium]